MKIICLDQEKDMEVKHQMEVTWNRGSWAMLA